jgi:hypothetical protein
VTVERRLRPLTRAELDRALRRVQRGRPYWPGAPRPLPDPLAAYQRPTTRGQREGATWIRFG